MIDLQGTIEEFYKRRETRLAGSWDAYPRNNPIASDLHDCSRYQVIGMLAWREKPLPDLTGQQVIEEGQLQEDKVIRQMQDEGWEVVQQQVRFEMRGQVAGRQARIISGKIDGKLKIDVELIPFEVKSTSQYRYASIHSQDDLQSDVWFRKWWRQCQMYLLGENAEKMLLIISDCRGARKPIEITLDLEEAERILKLCEWTMWQFQALDGCDVSKLDSLLNEREIPYHHDFSICQRCDWRDRVCFPAEPATAEGVPIRDWLEADCEQYLKLKEDAAKYRKVDKGLQDESRGHPIILAGGWVIEGRQAGQGWKKTIRKVGEKP